MQRRLPAIALCMLMHAAMAGPPAAATTRPQATQQELLPAALVAQTQTAPAPRRADGDAVAMQAPRPAAPSPGPSAEEHEHRPTGLAMLLAAVALMTGIALRRWGAGDQ